MRTLRCSLLLLASACGVDPTPTDSSREDCHSLRAIDRVSLLGPGSSRPISMAIERVEGAGYERFEPRDSPGRDGNAVLDHGRLVGLAPGTDTIMVEHGSCVAEIEVEVLDESPFVHEVIDLAPGLGAGFGMDALPAIVLGPPRGAGPYAGSVDVLSLGVGGQITLGFGPLVAYDGPGPDLIVFENAFLVPGTSHVFAEPAEVELGRDGTFELLPCDPTPPRYSGCVGAAHVLAGEGEGSPAPTDPERAGGDLIDLDGRLDRVDSIRLRDVTTATTGDNSGFDLDAVALIHALPSAVEGLACGQRSTELAVGELAPWPRVDARSSDGRIIFGVEPQIRSLTGTSVQREESFLSAVEPGTTVIELAVGEWTASCEVRVK